MDMQEQALQVSALRSESESQNEPDMEKANRTSSSILPFTNPPVNHLVTLEGGNKQTIKTHACFPLSHTANAKILQQGCLKSPLRTQRTWKTLLCAFWIQT